MIHRLAILSIFLAFSMLVFVEVQAQALQLVKPFTGTINKAVSTTLSKRLTNLGFAANDPIYGATMAAAQNVVGLAVVGGSVAATVAAVASAPVWLSIALGLGAAYEIYDFTMGSKKFKAESFTQKITLSNTVLLPAASPVPAAPLTVVSVPPAILPIDYADQGVGVLLTYPTNSPLCATFTTSGISGFVASVPATKTSATLCGTTEAIQNAASAMFMNAMVRDFTGNGYALVSVVASSSTGPTVNVCTINQFTCPEGRNHSFFRGHTSRFSLNGVLQTRTDFPSYTYRIFVNPQYINPDKQLSVNDAAALLSNGDLLSQADPLLIAAIANQIWKKASEAPLYVGVPYNPSNPITAQNVRDDIAAGLYPHPSVQDLLSPATSSPNTAPVFDPAAQPVTPPASDAPTLDLGPNPGIATPGLEEAPTGQTIVAFVMGKLPSFAAFQVPAHASQCVAPALVFYGNNYSFQSMCDLAEQQRALLASIFLAIWGVSAISIVLKA